MDKVQKKMLSTFNYGLITIVLGGFIFAAIDYFFQSKILALLIALLVLAIIRVILHYDDLVYSINSFRNNHRSGR